MTPDPGSGRDDLAWLLDRLEEYVGDQWSQDDSFTGPYDGHGRTSPAEGAKPAA